MRPVRFCLLIMAMLSLALLPGPAHALTHAHPTSAHLTHAHSAVHHEHHAVAHHHSTMSGESFAIHHHHDRTAHHHGPGCESACCGSMCSAYAPPMMAMTRVGHVQAAPMPTSDRPRADANQARSLRPPEHA